VAAGSGCLESGVGAFSDEVPFEFSEGREDVEDEPAAGGAGVDVLLEEFEFDASLLQCVHVVDQMAYGSAEAVEAPNHEGVSGSELVQELVEFRSGFECAGGGVCKDAIAAGFGECIVLELCVLVAGGNSGVSKEVSHAYKCIDTREVWVFSIHSLWH